MGANITDINEIIDNLKLSNPDIPDTAYWVVERSIRKNQELDLKVFVTSPKIKELSTLNIPNGLDVFYILEKGSYFSPTEGFVSNVYLNSLLYDNIFALVQIHNKDNTGLEELRKVLLKNIKNKDIILYQGNGWKVYEAEPDENISLHMNTQTLISILELYFKVETISKDIYNPSTGKSHNSQGIKINRNPGLYFYLRLSRNPNEPLNVVNRPLILIDTNGKTFPFPLDRLRSISEFFEVKYTSTLEPNKFQHESPFSDNAIEYLQRFVYNVTYLNDDEEPYSKYLYWINKDFDISLIPELFEMMDQYQITDETFGVELLMVVYFLRDDIMDVSEFIEEIRHINVPNEWNTYREMLQTLIETS